MSLLGRLTLLFVVVPILELVLLIQLGGLVGLWPTLALVLLTGVAGATLARAEGLRVLWAFQQEVAEGRLPGQALQDGIAVLIGGAFLLTPGILTDVVGFSLLLPPSRRWIQARFRRSLKERVADGSVQFVFTGPTVWGQTTPESPRAEDLDPAHEIRVDDTRD
ncbi:MAG: FxsA family protein [Gemmatimonadetes bacterium]|nr:FxsA family protein [Gemmatimonadota bacterium]